MKATGVISLILSIGLAAVLSAQTGAPSHKGEYERSKAHGKSLEGNLYSADRDVSVYLSFGKKKK